MTHETHDARKPVDDGQRCIWTIGHSTRDDSEFLEILRRYDIGLLADVRRFPGSRKYPHFQKENLGHYLSEAGIGYRHFPELGGRRRPLPDSPNTVWRNEAFRGYADYMETAEFRSALEQLRSAAAAHRCAIMCAEAVWWRCHRALIADILKAESLTVIHIMGLDKSEAHPYTSAARFVDGKLTYRDVEQGKLFEIP